MATVEQRRQAHDAAAGRELLDRMDAGEPLNDDKAGLEEASEPVGAGAGASSSPGGLEEAAAVGQTAVSGSAPVVGEPERAATSSSPEPDVEAAQTPAGDGAVDPPEAKRKGRNDRWTREAIVAAIRAEAERTGFVPQQRDWSGPSTDEHPNNLHAQRVFGNWGNAIEAAGYPRPRRGQKRVALNGSEEASRPEPPKWLTVPGTGLRYRDAGEALAAAQEIEADGDRVAEQARADGNDPQAVDAIVQSHMLAERIRAAAENREPNIHETIHEPIPDPPPQPEVAKPEEPLRLLVTPDDMPPFQRAIARSLIAGMRAAADALEQELA